MLWYLLFYLFAHVFIRTYSTPKRPHRACWLRVEALCSRRPAQFPVLPLDQLCPWTSHVPSLSFRCLSAISVVVGAKWHYVCKPLSTMPHTSINYRICDGSDGDAMMKMMRMKRRKKMKTSSSGGLLLGSGIKPPVATNLAKESRETPFPAPRFPAFFGWKTTFVPSQDLRFQLPVSGEDSPQQG